MQSIHSTGASDAPLAYRVEHFCKAVGLGKTKFYELVRDGKITSQAQPAATSSLGGRHELQASPSPEDAIQRAIVAHPTARAAPELYTHRSAPSLRAAVPL